MQALPLRNNNRLTVSNIFLHLVGKLGEAFVVVTCLLLRLLNFVLLKNFITYCAFFVEASLKCSRSSSDSLRSYSRV